MHEWHPFKCAVNLGLLALVPGEVAVVSPDRILTVETLLGLGAWTGITFVSTRAHSAFEGPGKFVVAPCLVG